MAEPVLLSLSRSEWDSMYRLAYKGELWAADQIDALWDGYKDQPVPCFLCDHQCGWPVPNTLILPEHGDPRRVLAAPLCWECGELPQMVKFNRAIHILREMFRKEGCQYHVTFNPKRRHPR
jgi:hypothetical protein